MIARLVSGCLCLVAGVAASATAQAQSVADFYRGKTVTLIVGSEPGGGYDLTARVVARHLARHIPGHPAIVVQNKPGAGSVIAANYTYEVASKDGTVIAGVQRPIPFLQIFGDPSPRYDARKIHWLGSTSNELGVVAVWHTAPQRTLDDLFKIETIVGSVGVAADTDIYPRALNKILGTKFKIVGGYRGQAAISLAMERGEIQGTGNWSWSDIEKGKLDWLRAKKIRILLQLDLKKGSSPWLRDVPQVMDIARNDEQRSVFRILMAMKALGRPYFVAPGVPADRVEALRTAFGAMMSDPEFVEEARRTLGSVDPVLGADMQKIVADIYASPANVIAVAREAVKLPGAN